MKENKYMYNPLSSKSSNKSVEVIYASGKSSLHNNIHYPDSYVRKVFEDPDIIGAKVYIDGEFYREHKKNINTKAEPDDDLPF